MNDFKAQKKARLEKAKIREEAELRERAHRAVGSTLKGFDQSELRVIEAYLDKLRKAREELARQYADLPQVGGITALFDAEIGSAARLVARLTIEKLNSG